MVVISKFVEGCFINNTTGLATLNNKDMHAGAIWSSKTNMPSI